MQCEVTCRLAQHAFSHIPVSSSHWHTEYCATQTCSQFHFLLKQREGACNGQTLSLWADFVETDRFIWDSAGEHIRFVSLNQRDLDNSKMGVDGCPKCIKYAVFILGCIIEVGAISYLCFCVWLCESSTPSLICECCFMCSLCVEWGKRVKWGFLRVFV